MARHRPFIVVPSSPCEWASLDVMEGVTGILLQTLLLVVSCPRVRDAYVRHLCSEAASELWWCPSTCICLSLVEFEPTTFRRMSVLGFVLVCHYPWTPYSFHLCFQHGFCCLIENVLVLVSVYKRI